MSVDYANLVLDARPDRLDLRDREYRPHLKSLPPEFPGEHHIKTFLPCYVDNGLILDQGQEGACTGFGLAATINYLLWRDAIAATGDVQACTVGLREQRVSERMLYHLARIYDEWEGEDYSGSSCRGAMKGWHRHGVCRKSLWDYDPKGKFLPPQHDWASNALQNPLGAYYRINHQSVVDMQAAITEVGAIYCSASVHSGWQITRARKLPNIKPGGSAMGGHAFCIIGYTSQGFIVQNSWGEDWGWKGFAVLSYPDWVANGTDAWVASRGVPVAAKAGARFFASSSLHSVATAGKPGAGYPYPANYAAAPWSEQEAYEHALVIGNNGRPKHTAIAAASADDSVKAIVFDNVKQWLDESPTNRKLAIYAHGGLNSEEAGIKRVQILAPCFKANSVYPLFVVWKTGLMETVSNMVREALGLAAGPERAEGLGEWISDKTDRAIESFARGIKAKGFWSEMKENAEHASDRAVPGFAQNRGGKAGAMVLLAQQLQALVADYPDLQIHVVGHSAGSIVLGAWLKELAKRQLVLASATLYAPACTLAFANKTYKPALQQGLLPIARFYIHNMDDERERADNTGGLYRKSLLYLVSRALEDIHKMPLLGLAAAWNPDNYDGKRSGGFHASQKSEAEQWQQFFATVPNPPQLHTVKQRKVQVDLRGKSIDLGHGSFDNDVKVVSKTLEQIRGEPLSVKIHNLAGF